MTAEDRCPSCRADLRAGEIPDEHRHHYSPDATHFSNRVGVEVPGVSDGVLYWMCPHCNHRWHRWPEGHPLRVRAEEFISRPEGPVAS